MALGAVGLWEGLTHSPLVMAGRKMVLEQAQEDERCLIVGFFSKDARIAEFLGTRFTWLLNFSAQSPSPGLLV